MKAFRYRNIRIGVPEFYRGQSVTRIGSQEVLTGVVQGMKASDLEERVARALGKIEIPFQFRARITSQALGDRELTRRFANIKGEIEIDHLCDDGGLITPVFVDGQIAHFFTPWQADLDKEKTDSTNEFGRQFGWKPAVRVPFWKLIDQNMTDRTIRDIFR